MRQHRVRAPRRRARAPRPTCTVAATGSLKNGPPQVILSQHIISVGNRSCVRQVLWPPVVRPCRKDARPRADGGRRAAKRYSHPVAPHGTPPGDCRSGVTALVGWWVWRRRHTRGRCPRTPRRRRRRPPALGPVWKPGRRRPGCGDQAWAAQHGPFLGRSWGYRVAGVRLRAPGA